MAGGMGREVFHRAAVAEAAAIRAVLVKCRDLGSDKVEVESDALFIIQMLNGERSIDASLELFDIKAFASQIMEVKFMSVQRSGNLAAHAMALYATSSGGSFL